MSAVIPMPKSNPKIGLEKSATTSKKAAEFCKGSMARIMVSIPNIKTAKPRNTPDFAFFVSFFAVNRIMMPIRARMGEKELGLSI